jgi:hypothetical protein
MMNYHRNKNSRISIDIAQAREAFRENPIIKRNTRELSKKLKIQEVRILIF